MHSAQCEDFWLSHFPSALQVQEQLPAPTEQLSLLVHYQQNKRKMHIRSQQLRRETCKRKASDAKAFALPAPANK